jgi:hypothetical protein
MNMVRRAKQSRMGRPPLFGERMRRVNIILSDDDLKRAKTIGKGNVSAGIRAALKESAVKAKKKARP